MMAPHYRAICDAFYAAVASNATAAAMLGDPGRASRLRVTLIDWMDSGLRGPHDEAFYRSARGSAAATSRSPCRSSSCSRR
jgi:hypothetical protein